MDDVVSVSLGGFHTLALRSNGSLWAWGWNYDHENSPRNPYGTPWRAGMIGDGTTEDRLRPVHIMDNVMLPPGATASEISGTTGIVTASPWAVNNINQAISLGLVPQNLQNNYTANTTRAEFAALAVALFERGTGWEITQRANFNDTNDINVQKMGGLGVVTGVGGGNFNPNGTVTRQEAAVMLARLAHAMAIILPEANPTFADNAQIASWATGHVGQIQAAGIMGGVGNNQFNPTGNFTIEQSIITMLRLFEEIN